MVSRAAVRRRDGSGRNDVDNLMCNRISTRASPILIRGWALFWLALLMTGNGRAADLELLPGESYLAAGPVRGRLEPGFKTYTLTNTGNAMVEWSAGRVGGWYSVLEPGGVLAPGTSTNLLVFPNSLSVHLGPDLFQGLLVVTNVGTGEELIRAVDLKISMPGPGSVETVLALLTNLMQIQFEGPPGDIYVVEATGDFQTWSGKATNVFGSEPAYFDVDLTEPGPRYFRTRILSSNAPPSTLVLANLAVEDPDRIRLLGTPGGTYLVETSEDDLNWTPVLTNRLPASGSAVLTNHVTGGNTNLSYRATALGPFASETVHHVLITGQSLALGAAGSPALSTTPSERHYRFHSDGTFRFLIPLVETGLETIASGVGWHLAASHPEHRLLFSNSSLGGAGYEDLKKGSGPYNQALTQFRDTPQEVAGALLSYQPSAVFVIHGEGDHLNANYDLNIRQWQEDYERDIGIVSGQPGAIPMFHSQASAWTSPGNGSSEFTIGAFLTLEESRRNPNRTILVCPKYFLNYADGIHLTNASYRWLGEYYAKAYREVVVEGGTWTPLQPLTVTRTNTMVTATFLVPVPPLVLDTTLVSNPGQYGFLYHDGSATPPGILSVEVVAPDTLRLVLDAVPAGTQPEFLRYAYVATPGSYGGPQTGPRGNLRDSDNEVSLYGETLYNWCVHFDEPVAVEARLP